MSVVHVVRDQLTDLAVLRGLLLVQGLRRVIKMLGFRSVQSLQKAQRFASNLRDVHVDHQSGLLAMAINARERFLFRKGLEKRLLQDDDLLDGEQSIVDPFFKLLPALGAKHVEDVCPRSARQHPDFRDALQCLSLATQKDGEHLLRLVLVMNLLLPAHEFELPGAGSIGRPAGTNERTEMTGLLNGCMLDGRQGLLVQGIRNLGSLLS